MLDMSDSWRARALPPAQWLWFPWPTESKFIENSFFFDLGFWFSFSIVLRSSFFPPSFCLLLRTRMGSEASWNICKCTTADQSKLSQAQNVNAHKPEHPCYSGRPLLLHRYCSLQMDQPTVNNEHVVPFKRGYMSMWLEWAHAFMRSYKGPRYLNNWVTTSTNIILDRQIFPRHSDLRL